MTSISYLDLEHKLELRALCIALDCLKPIETVRQSHIYGILEEKFLKS